MQEIVESFAGNLFNQHSQQIVTCIRVCPALARTEIEFKTRHFIQDIHVGVIALVFARSARRLVVLCKTVNAGSMIEQLPNAYRIPRRRQTRKIF